MSKGQLALIKPVRKEKSVNSEKSLVMDYWRIYTYGLTALHYIPCFSQTEIVRSKPFIQLNFYDIKKFFLLQKYRSCPLCRRYVTGNFLSSFSHYHHWYILGNIILYMATFISGDMQVLIIRYFTRIISYLRLYPEIWRCKYPEVLR